LTGGPATGALNAAPPAPITGSMSKARSAVAVLAALAAALLAGCGAAGEAPHRVASAKVANPVPPPAVVLTKQDRAVWRSATTGRARVPVLLYHGVAERAEFSNQADAFYAIAPAEFAKQMALLHLAGYTAITLEQFHRFHAREPVDLPDHPILLTFDDGRADALRNADQVLARYAWSAVMFVDVGAVTNRSPEYATWQDLAAMQGSGRWSVQLHAGRGHHNIRYGAGAGDVGPFYAYRDALHGETLTDWHRRVVADLEWGDSELRRHVPGYRPLAFAPPFGAYGQLSTNDPEIPALMSRELRERFGLVFVQDDPRPSRPGEADVTRLQLDRTMTGGELHYWLATA
jgi:peptidoglycan/xylan/chitin deacetylase (PgdA/CDA1 family)